MSDLDNTLFLCLDCETTGLNVARDDIIEIGAKFFNLHSTLEVLSSLVHTDREISVESMKIHNISNSMLDSAPSFASVFLSLSQAVHAHKPFAILGHFVGFDIDILKQHAMRYDLDGSWLDNLFVIDTLKLARKFMPHLNSFSLSSLCEELGAANVPNHRALEDVESTVQVFIALVKTFNVHSMEELQNIMTSPCYIEKMPFGKYKGVQLKQIPHGYLSHIYRNLDLDRDLSHSIYEIIKGSAGSTFL